MNGVHFTYLLVNVPLLRCTVSGIIIFVYELIEKALFSLLFLTFFAKILNTRGK